MAVHDIDEARTIARAIIQRIIQDSEFANQLRTDPRGTLLDAGVPDWAVDDFITHDLGLEADVSGYAFDDCAVTSLLGWNDGDGLENN